MDVVRIDDVADLANLADPTGPARAREPFCVILSPAAVDADRVADLARLVGAEPVAAELFHRSSHRRALAHADGPRISFVAFATGAAGPPAEVHVHAGTRGLLVVCPEAVADAIREAVAPVHGPATEALAAVLVALAQLSEERVHELADLALALDSGTSGLTSGAQRRDISRLRSQLFSLQQLWTSHQQMLAADDVLAEALAGDARRVRRARSLFESSTTTAVQLYALLGDTLSRQATVISERLTLVTIVFLPLTVSTGFFGMNFGWMTDHIGSRAAFVVLGIVMPVVLVAATLFGTRRVAGD